MHSKDRTQLANFGFRDPDKRDRRHDLACQYIAKQEIAEALLRFVVVTAFPLTVEDVRMLKNEGIGHALLGDGFNRFVESAKNDQAESLEL